MNSKGNNRTNIESLASDIDKKPDDKPSQNNIKKNDNDNDRNPYYGSDSDNDFQSK